MKTRSIFATLLFVAVISFSTNLFAQEEKEVVLASFTSPGNGYVLNYEIVSSDGKTLFRTKVAQFTKLNNGNKRFGEMVAGIALNKELMTLVLKPEIEKTGDTTKIHRSAMVVNGAQIEGNYAVIDLDEVRVTGIKFTSADLVKMCE